MPRLSNACYGTACEVALPANTTFANVESLSVFVRVYVYWSVVPGKCADLCYKVLNTDGAGKKHFFSIAELGAYAMRRRRSQDRKPLAFRKSLVSRYSILCTHL
jgi:hypothetical protein